jgi:cell wall-associated NlpC family hydrolase
MCLTETAEFTTNPLSPQPWEIAKRYVGAPFLHMGRTPRGMDCVGLLALVARNMGLDPIDRPYYGREPARNDNAESLRDYLIKNFGEPVTRPYQPNDVLLMRLRPRFAPSHVAMVAPHRYGLALIHTYGEVGRVVYQRIDEARHHQIAEVYEWAAIQAKSLA